MFGDCGHGLIMFLFALWLVCKEKRLQNYKGGGEVSHCQKRILMSCNNICHFQVELTRSLGNSGKVASYHIQ